MRINADWTHDELARWVQPAQAQAKKFQSWLDGNRHKDTGRQKVYAAENLMDRYLASAEMSTAGEVEVDGAVFRPEQSGSVLGSESDAQKYINSLMRSLHDRGLDYGGQESIPCLVVLNPSRRSTVRYSGLFNRIELPNTDSWTLSLSVLQHELAHHLSDGCIPPDDFVHGVHFRSTFVRLLRDIGLPERSRLLLSSYRAEGLKTVAPD